MHIDTRSVCVYVWRATHTPDMTHQAGTDTDALAVKASQRNAALNDVAGALTVVQCQPQLNDDEPLAAHGLAACGYDVVLANILQGPLLDLGPRLSAYVRPGGLLALSGILETQVSGDACEMRMPVLDVHATMTCATMTCAAMTCATMTCATRRLQWWKRMRNGLRTCRWSHRGSGCL